jgi:hypothetical protein
MLQNEARNKEIVFAITQNLQLDYINKYYILCENQESFDSIKEYANDKTVILLYNQRLTYDDIFQISNKYTTDQSINILINSDIILTNFKEINSFFVKNNVFLCVSRYEKDGQLIHIPHISQDVWAWKGLNQIKNGNFYMGTLGCDTAIAYRAIESGYKTINPCRHLIATHNHASNYRTYDETRMTFGANTFPLTPICIARPTYYDRSAMLQLSLEYQKDATNSENFETYVFVDPRPEHGIVSDYDQVITDEYNRIDWKQNSGKYSWYDSVKYIFHNTSYEYVLSIEDDVLISKDYLRMCEQLALHDGALSKDDNILYFHIGAWESPRGNPNKIIRSSASSRSILIHRSKFEVVKDWVATSSIIDNDHMISNILKNKSMTTIAPQMNRHGHIGIYGWSATHKHADADGQESLFGHKLSHDELYSVLKMNCLSGQSLLKLNQNKNPDYFWDFDPNINFTKLEYNL